jgi:hypothetical protein
MLFKNSVLTSKRTPYFTITKINWLMLFTVRNMQYTVAQSIELQVVEIAGTYNYHYVLKG